MKKVAKNRARDIRALQRMKDAEIDLNDIPEIKDWRAAVVGRFAGLGRSRGGAPCGLKPTPAR